MLDQSIKIAIIDNSLDPSVYNPVRHWSLYLKEEWYSFRAKDGLFPDLGEGFTHIILTGSEASILDDYPWVAKEIKIIQEAVKNNISILGSCYGHQLLALAFGGKTCVRRSEHPEVGWFPIQIKKNSQLLGKEEKIYSFSCHFDEVVNLGTDYEILAYSAHCQIQAFKMKGRHIWGLQMHPEININEARFFLQKLVSLNLPTSPYFTQALGQKPRDSEIITRIAEVFLSV